MPETPRPSDPARKNLSVPRDRDTDETSSRAREPMPSADETNAPDEIYTDQAKPLTPGSREERELHDRPRHGKGQLGVGTAGDSARPTKEGIHNKPLFPRGQM